MGGRDALDQRRTGWGAGMHEKRGGRGGGQGCIRREEDGVGGRDALEERRTGWGAGMH